MGIVEKKASLVPKGKFENGYRKEKAALVPKGKFENGY